MKQRGFTIVELAVAIAVVGILAVITVVSFRAAEEDASVTAIETDVKQALQQAASFRHEHGAFPSEDEHILSMRLKPNRTAYHHNGSNYGICSGDRSFGIIAISREGDTYAQTTSTEFEQFDETGSLLNMCGSLLSDSSTIIFSTWGRTDTDNWSSVLFK